MTLAKGRPDLFSEMPVTVQGLKNEIDSLKWIITLCTRSITTTERICDKFGVGN